jgi:hypothetical protein
MASAGALAVNKWEHAHPDCPNSTGASLLVDNSGNSSNSNGKVFVIGGGDLKRSPYLSVSAFDLGSANWKQNYVNSYGAPNRAYAQAFTINNKGYILGGQTVHREQGCSELTQLTSSPFGVELRTATANPLFARYGHTATVVGPKLNRVLVYGGKTLTPSPLLAQSPPIVLTPPPVEAAPAPEAPQQGKAPAKGAKATPAPAPAAAAAAPEPEPQNINPNIFILNFETEIPTMLGIELEGEGPVAVKEFHSATVCGSQNQFVLVFGGKQGVSITSDLYLLDLSACLGLAAADDVGKQGKGADKKKDPKKGGGAPTGPVAVWYKIFDASKTCDARYLHNAFSSGTSLCVFGGLSTRTSNQQAPDGSTVNKFSSNTRYTLNVDAVVNAVTTGTKQFAGMDFNEQAVGVDSQEWSEDERANALLCTDSCNESICVPVADPAQGSNSLPVCLLSCGGVLVDSGTPSPSSLRLLPLISDNSSELLNSLRRAVKSSGFYKVRSETEGTPCVVCSFYHALLILTKGPCTIFRGKTNEQATDSVGIQ